MDNMEFYRQKFIDELMKLKEKYDLPDMETDKIILDFDNIGQYIDDEKALEAYSGQLLDAAEYRANAGKSPNPYDDEPKKTNTPLEDFDLFDDSGNKVTGKWEDGQINYYENGKLLPDDDPRVIEERYQQAINNEPGQPLSPEQKEFNQIINNEQSTHWWRYDDSYNDEAKDYMERYTTGDLTDEEMQELLNDQKMQEETNSKIREAKAQYDAEVADTAGKLGITDTKAFKTLVQVGAKLLNAIDEELIYSPLLLAEKGLKALGLAVPGKAIGGLGRAAMAYEGYLFQAQLGLAALSQGATAMAGGASRLPGEIANGILNLYGAGMPEGLAPDVETGMSAEEQAKRQEMMFYNQMYQYSRLSPSLRLFTDVIGPKTGTYDVIQGYQTGFDRFSKMLGGNK